MRLGLRMGLNSRQGGGGDLPSLDLAFALDRSFTTDPAAAGNALITSRRGPTAKFSRGTGATQVNAAGLIEYAPENLILPSGSATNVAATYFTRVVTGELDPDGDTTAEFTSLATVSQARLNYAGIVGFSYFSVWVKSKEGSPLPAFIHLVAGDGPKSRFDTSNWAILNEQGAIGSVEYGANGWVKLRSLFPATTASSLFKIVMTDGPTYGDGIAAGKVFILGGKQASRNNSSQHYKTTSSAFYGPRFDYDPATGDSKGLLIEESRSNIYLRSDNFADSNWTKTRLSIQTDATIAPDGAMTADKLIEDTTVSNTHTIGSSVTPPATPHTLSVFAKKGERDFIVLRLGGTNDFFNLNTGVAITNNNSPKITNFGNGWYRCTVTSSAGTQGSFQLSADGITSSYTGDGTSGIYLWGAQLEAGSFPLSYIPTTSGTAIRSADVCSIISTDFSSFYNQSEGTVITKVINAPGIEANTQYPFSFSGASSANLLIAYRVLQLSLKIGRFASIVSSSDTLSDSANAGTLSDGATDIIGFAIKLNDFAGSLDGNLITDNTVTLPTVDRIFIGSRFDGTRYWNGHIARIQYFRKRLSNAKLQTLTAP